MHWQWPTVSQNAYVYAGRQCTTKAHTINATNNVYHIKRDHLRISPSWECSRHQLASNTDLLGWNRIVRAFLLAAEHHGSPVTWLTLWVLTEMTTLGYVRLSYLYPACFYPSMRHISGYQFGSLPDFICVLYPTINHTIRVTPSAVLGTT